MERLGELAFLLQTLEPVRQSLLQRRLAAWRLHSGSGESAALSELLEPVN